nr:hypothetical protein GCM10020093_045330 [Planobispora longispora]
MVANAGTVNTVDFDDLRAIAALRERHPFWLHVDAAFGAFAALSRTRPSGGRARRGGLGLRGPAQVAERPLQQRDPVHPPPRPAGPGLRQLGRRLPGPRRRRSRPRAPDPENSRRLHAVPAWFTLAAYGREGHAEVVRRDIALAELLGERIAALPGYRLLAPVRLNVVCFTLAEAPERVGELVTAITESGEAFLTPTVYDGVPALRAAFSNWRTTEADVERVAGLLGRLAP